MGISARASVSPVVIVNGLVRVTGVSRKKLFFAIHPPHNLGGDFGILVEFTYFWKSTGSELWCLDAWVDRTVSRGSVPGAVRGIYYLFESFRGRD